MTDWLIVFLNYAIFIPASWLCIHPVWKYTKRHQPFHIFFGRITLILMIVILILCQIDIHTPMNTQFIFYSFLAVCGVFYYHGFNVQRGMLFYIFSFVMCIFCFATLISYYWDALFYPTSTYNTTSIEGCLSQWIAAILISIFFALLFGKRLEWLVEKYREEPVWYAMALPSWIIIFCTIIMVPHEYENLYIGRSFSVLIHITVTLIILFIITHMIFYKLARLTYDKAAMEQEKQLMTLQLHQSELQNTYIAETHRLRHDFKHSVLALSSLLQQAKYEEASDYLSHYYDHLDNLSSYIDFCDLPALNALLNEYFQQAGQVSIKLRHSINISTKLSLDEIHLCVIVGNLLNNAIAACKKLPIEDRFIKLYIDTEADQQLYLIIQNSYDGNLHWIGSEPTHLPQGHYGILSVKSIVEENGGIARFYTEDNVFLVEIMMPITSK